MFSWLTSIFETSSYPARWNCGPGWAEAPGWGWAIIISDLLIALAYLAIPLVLLWFVRHRGDLPFPRIFWLFGAFILACGSTHFLESLIFWWPAYRISAVLKVATATISIGTVFALLNVVPIAMALRSPRQMEDEVRARVSDLQRVTEQLREEVDARQQMERTLRESEERLRMALRAGRMGTWDWELSSNQTRTNTTEFDLFEMQGHVRPVPIETLLKQVHPEDSQQVRLAVRTAVDRKGEFEEEFRIIRADGQSRWLAGRADVVCDSRGKPVRMIGVHYDITDRKIAALQLQQEILARKATQQSLERSEDWLKMVLRAGRMGTWDWNPWTNSSTLDLKELELLGVSGDPGEMPATVFFDRVHPEDRGPLETAIRDCLDNHNEYESEFRIVRPDGEIRWLAARGDTILDEQGRAIRLVGVNFDVTDRKLIEERLRLSDRALQTATNGIMIADARRPDMPIVYVNPSTEAITGYSAEEFLGRNARFLQGPQTNDADVEQLRTAIAKETDCHVVLLNYRKDGMPFWNELWFSPVRDDRGRLTHFVAVQADVTEQKETEQALLESAHFLRRVLDSLFVFAGVCTPEGTLIEANRAMLDAAGLKPEHVIGHPFEETWWWSHDESAREHVREALRQAAKGETCRYDATLRRGNDGVIPVDFQIVPMRNDDGVITHLVPSAIDISERKESERSLEIARQQANAASEAKSEFLANMSHEIRTPLAGILGCADTLLPRLESDEQRELLQMIRSQGRLLLGILNDILDLSKIEAGRIEIHREATILPQLMEEVRSLLGPQAAEKGLALVTQFEGRVPKRVETDPLRVRQILLNLVGNAVKFTESGTVAMKMRCDVSSEPAAVEISVCDTGVGIPPDKVDRIFEAFEQGGVEVTRRFGGTGLGLTICQRLIRLLHGEIRVESQLGSGTVFTVRLPVGTASALDLVDAETFEFVRKVEPSTEFRGRMSIRVLVVEDNRGLQLMLKRMLESHVLDVKVVGNGEAAIQEVERGRNAGAAFDVLLMDMHMPVLNGFDATARLRAAGDRTPIIALTAGAMSGDRERCLSVGCDDYLSKPIDRTQLLSLLHDRFPGSAAPHDGD